MYPSSKRTLLAGFVLFFSCAVSGTPAFAAPAVSLTSAIYDDNTDADFSSVRPGGKMTLTFTVADSASVWVKYTFNYAGVSYQDFDAGTRRLDADGRMTKTLTVPSREQGMFTFYVEVNDVKSNEITQQITASDWTDEPTQETPAASPSSDSGGGGCSAGFGMILPILPVAFALLRKKR
jgi:hypothetical protein